MSITVYGKQNSAIPVISNKTRVIESFASLGNQRFDFVVINGSGLVLDMVYQKGNYTDYLEIEIDGKIFTIDYSYSWKLHPFFFLLNSRISVSPSSYDYQPKRVIPPIRFYNRFRVTHAGSSSAAVYTKGVVLLVTEV